MSTAPPTSDTTHAASAYRSSSIPPRCFSLDPSPAGRSNFHWRDPREYRLEPLPTLGGRFGPDGEPWPASRLSVAPMMEVTDRHFRFMMRLLSRKCKLYTEMVVDQTLLYNLEPYVAQEYFLGNTEVEHPVALQLGGNDPELLGRAAAAAEAAVSGTTSRTTSFSGSFCFSGSCCPGKAAVGREKAAARRAPAAALRALA
mmetsp:Transcript_70485/g.159455  ORF Transcript_70485/g.159455 Transcript_70485/m.159455 type:complete len:200 (+) Transcript_70485:60-659(+)